MHSPVRLRFGRPAVLNRLSELDDKGIRPRGCTVVVCPGWCGRADDDRQPCEAGGQSIVVVGLLIQHAMFGLLIAGAVIFQLRMLRHLTLAMQEELRPLDPELEHVIWLQC